MKIFKLCRSLSFIGALFILFTLIIFLVPLSFYKVNTDLTLDFWAMPLIYKLNNGTAVSLSVGYEDEVVDAKFYSEEGFRDAITASYAGIIYREGQAYWQAYFNIINLEVQTENMPYITATASFNINLSLIRDGSIMRYLYVLRNSTRLAIPRLNFTYISKIGDGNYTIAWRGRVEYHINTIVEKVDESRELNFGYLNITVSKQKVVYVQHYFKVFSETISVESINPILFKVKKLAPLTLLPTSGILQIPTAIFYLKNKLKNKARLKLKS